MVRADRPRHGCFHLSVTTKATVGCEVFIKSWRFCLFGIWLHTLSSSLCKQNEIIMLFLCRWGTYVSLPKIVTFKRELAQGMEVFDPEFAESWVFKHSSKRSDCGSQCQYSLSHECHQGAICVTHEYFRKLIDLHRYVRTCVPHT